ncbi:MAG: Nif3-like dinuclear metal center hexameric protein [Bacteroidetes bacterium MedPE-SWsnd-G2]|nr:MAG: Nif3-like dinuclear metal center hexameric protein [Bacteroidetes bacterium MedPE-SWsnd-G2]
MIVKDVINHLETLAPLNYAEDFDNVGLLVGDKSTKLKGVLVTLDTTEAVVDEAIENNCNLVVSFHPIIFKGLKRLNGSNYVERVAIKAIKHDIAIYSMHTALDNSHIGVSAIMANKLGLTNQNILLPKKSTILKLTTYAPINEAESIKNALFNAGAGTIGNYDNCSFATNGIGTFKANEAANPSIGEKGKRHSEEESKISVTFPKHLKSKVLSALFNAHSYEEVAYEIVSLENTNQNIGMGIVGVLPESADSTSFLQDLKLKFKTPAIRHSKLLDKPIKKVALLGGSGSFAIEAAINASADVYITADLKYHDFFRAENKIILADIGHYESEQYTKNYLADYLSKKITNFAIVLSMTNTNPVKYL